MNKPLEAINPNLLHNYRVLTVSSTKSGSSTHHMPHTQSQQHHNHHRHQDHQIHHKQPVPIAKSTRDSTSPRTTGRQSGTNAKPPRSPLKEEPEAFSKNNKTNLDNRLNNSVTLEASNKGSRNETGCIELYHDSKGNIVQRRIDTMLPGSPFSYPSWNGIPEVISCTLPESAEASLRQACIGGGEMIEIYRNSEDPPQFLMYDSVVVDSVATDLLDVPDKDVMSIVIKGQEIPDSGPFAENVTYNYSHPQSNSVAEELALSAKIDEVFPAPRHPFVSRVATEPVQEEAPSPVVESTPPEPQKEVIEDENTAAPIEIEQDDTNKELLALLQSVVQQQHETLVGNQNLLISLLQRKQEVQPPQG